MNHSISLLSQTLTDHGNLMTVTVVGNLIAVFHDIVGTDILPSNFYLTSLDGFFVELSRPSSKLGRENFNERSSDPSALRVRLIAIEVRVHFSESILEVVLTSLSHVCFRKSASVTVLRSVRCSEDENSAGQSEYI